MVRDGGGRGYIAAKGEIGISGFYRKPGLTQTGRDFWMGLYREFMDRLNWFIHRLRYFLEKKGIHLSQFFK